MAPALVALMPSNSIRPSSMIRSSTPQAKAPWAPPPCRARFTVFSWLSAVAVRALRVLTDMSMVVPRGVGLVKESVLGPAAVHRDGRGRHRCAGVGGEEHRQRGQL